MCVCVCLCFCVFYTLCVWQTTFNIPFQIWCFWADVRYIGILNAHDSRTTPNILIICIRFSRFRSRFWWIIATSMRKFFGQWDESAAFGRLFYVNHMNQCIPMAVWSLLEELSWYLSLSRVNSSVNDEMIVFFFTQNEQKKRIKNKSTWMMPTDESQLISLFRNSPVTNETATFALSHANFFSQTDLNLMRLAFKGIALNAARECTTMLTVITRDGLIEFHYMSTMYKILFTKFTHFSIFPDFLWMRNIFLCAVRALRLVLVHLHAMLWHHSFIVCVHRVWLLVWFFPSRRRNEYVHLVASITSLRKRREREWTRRFSSMHRNDGKTSVSIEISHTLKKEPQTKRIMPKMCNTYTKIYILWDRALSMLDSFIYFSEKFTHIWVVCIWFSSLSGHENRL